MGYRAFLFFCRRSPYIKRFSEYGGCPISRCCICPVRSYCVSLSFVILVFRVCTLSICPRRPESRESIRRRCAAPLHRNRTSPPSLWPGRELRMSHKHLLPIGSNYTLAEAGVPERYVEVAPQNVRIAWNEVTRQTVEDRLVRGSIRGIKVGKAGKPLPGAVFGLFAVGECRLCGCKILRGWQLLF